MNLNRRSFTLYLALLVALFKVTGVSATVEPWTPVADSREEIKVSDTPALWASEEIFQVVKLPEYSENQFFVTAAIPDGHYKASNLEFRLLTASYLRRDLKTIIRSLLFPFHFFL